MKSLAIGLLLTFSLSTAAQQVAPATQKAPAAVAAVVTPAAPVIDLFTAARVGDVAAISQLLKQKADVNA